MGLPQAPAHRRQCCRQDIHDAYNEKIDEGNLAMAWGSPNVKSWYKNEHGRVTQNWPGTMLEFWQQARASNPADFVLSGELHSAGAD